jgi:hypothetical protein
MAAGRTTVPEELRDGLERYKPEYLSPKVDEVMSRYGAAIGRHCGAVPPRLVAARIFLESRGNPKATAKAQSWYCGIHGSEIGLLQINPCNRKKYGLTDAQAMNPDTNIRYGCQIWNDWSESFFRQLPGATDRPVWMWLVTAVGPGAAKKLRTMAGGYNLSSLLSVAGDKALMDSARGSFGSQPPPLVSWRVGSAISAARSSGAMDGSLGIFGVVIGIAAGYYGIRYLTRS